MKRIIINFGGGVNGYKECIKCGGLKPAGYYDVSQLFTTNICLDCRKEYQRNYRGPEGYAGINQPFEQVQRGESGERATGAQPETTLIV